MQKYPYVPGTSKVIENESPGLTNPESHGSAPSGSSASPSSAAFPGSPVAVWSTEASFTHVTVPPTVIVTSAGSNRRPSVMVMVASLAGSVGDSAEEGD